MLRFVLSRLYMEFIVNGIAAWKIWPPIFRNMIYNLCGIKSKAWRIKANCYFITNQQVFGEGVYINNGCKFCGPVVLEDNVTIAMDVMFAAISHLVGDSNKRAGKETVDKITVGCGTWIGTRAVILPGVKIGKGCVIAAGSVVTENCEDNGLYAGVPAVLKKKLDATDILSRTTSALV